MHSIMSRLLFLSHSGADTEAAKALKARILATPAAQEHQLSVWFDKDDLRAGEPWQGQLEAAISSSHAFVVYVGSKDVVNWVEAEVRLALNRAITEPEYRFIPILAGAAPRAEALPGFARQFQSVIDVEAKPEQFDLLLRAVFGGAEAGQLQLEIEPFFGLRAIDESRNHLFFGRSKETEALVALVHRTPLVLVTGDSGSGKSSLVRAGLVPRFRGGAFALLEGRRPEDTISQVVTTRPRNQPFRHLGDAVDDAAKTLGLSLADRGTLADWAASGQIEQVRRALRCDLPPERVQVLLVVDQFEELLTITPPELRAPFIDLLLDFSDPSAGRHRVVLTMRHDYVNLCNAFGRLKERLDANDRRARFLLGRMSDEGLRRIVTEPLRLAAVARADSEALATEVLRDVGERPGDLALVQMALSETWRARDQHGSNLLRAYAAVGRVEGALAQAAEHARAEVLDAGQRELLDSVLLRLVRLGDTGGATRRVAARGEFDEARWSLVQKLASEDGKRLLLLRGSTDQPTVEIAHEALVTAWPYFQNLLQQAADDKRILDTLIPRAQAWAAEENQRARKNRLATGADLELFAALMDRRRAWLSSDEQGFVEASVSAEQTRQRRRKWEFLGAIAAVGAIWFYVEAQQQRSVAETRRVEAEKQTQIALSRLLAAQSTEYASQHPDLSVLLALAANNASSTPEARSALFAALARANSTTTLPRAAGSEANIAKFSPDDKVLALGTIAGDVVFWDYANRRNLAEKKVHAGAVTTLAFSPDANLLASGATDGTVILWDTHTFDKRRTLNAEAGAVFDVAFSRDGGSLRSASERAAILWRISDGEQIRVVHTESITNNRVVLSPDGEEVALAGDSVGLWDIDTDKLIAELKPVQNGSVIDVAFSQQEGTITTLDSDGAVTKWDAKTGRRNRKVGDPGSVYKGDKIAVSADGNFLVVSGTDITTWDVSFGTRTIVPVVPSRGGTVFVAISSDAHKLAWCAVDGPIVIWDRDVIPIHQTLKSQDLQKVGSLAFSPDGKTLASGDLEGRVLIWNVENAQQTAVLQTHGLIVGSIAFSGNHKLAAGMRNGLVTVWDTSRPGEKVVLPEGGVF
jgi:WD40 repeat protein